MDKSLLRTFAALLMMGGGLANAFSFIAYNSAVEYYNTISGHYFLTSSDVEKSAIAAGAAGPGWVKTGYSFKTTDQAPGSVGGNCPECVNVMRFHWSPAQGPGTHFLTIDPAESRAVQNSPGWTYEGVAFTILPPVNPGVCDQWSSPIYRLYNNRGAVGDPDHRYTASTFERSRMIAAGWVDEGVPFCTLGTADEGTGVFLVVWDRENDANIRRGNECEVDSIYRSGCIAVNNLPVPATPYTPQSDDDRARFDSITASTSDVVYVTEAARPDNAPQSSFIQAQHGLGIHIDSRDRGASNYSSINPMVTLPTFASADFDLRYFPWRHLAYETELTIAALVRVVRLIVRDGQSFAYGHPTIDFFDSRSGHHFLFNVLAYGNLSGPADFVASDATSGKPIVGTTFGSSTPYGRSLGETAKLVPSGTNTLSTGNWDFQFRMNRDEFERVLTSARSLDAALSTDPDDYMVHTFLFKNEVVGNGEIGLHLQALELRYSRRP